MNLRRRLRTVVALFVLSFVLLGSTLALSVQQRTQNFAQLTQALDADQLRSGVAVCVQDLQQQLALTSQTLDSQPGETGLEPNTLRELTDAIAACEHEATRYAQAAATGDEDTLSESFSNLFKHWNQVTRTLGTAAHTDALTTLAMDADPLAATLLRADLPGAAERYAAAVTKAREAFDLSARTSDLLLVVVGCLALISAGLVVVTVFSLEQGVRALLLGTTAYKAGELDHRIAVPDSQEFGDVATQMNEMASRLVEARGELEHRADRLEKSLVELRETQGQLVEQRKMAALGNLVAGVAHEVNTPLGVAITANSLLGDQLMTLESLLEAPRVSRRALLETASSGREAADLLAANLMRASQLIGSFKQVAVDRAHIETRALVLGQWLQSIASSLSPLMRKHGAAITLTSPPDLHVELSAGELEQALTNLCVNAVLHGYPPPHRRESPEEVVPVRIHCSQSDAALSLRVEDDGAGMPSDVLAKVFDPFFTTKRGSGGTGLGMHIVHQVVTTGFGGTIEVESTPGAGTAWTLRLPFGSPALRRRAEGTS